MSRLLFIIPMALLLTVTACKKEEAPGTETATTPPAPSAGTAAPTTPPTPPSPPEPSPAAPATPPAAAPGTTPSPAAPGTPAPGAAAPSGAGAPTGGTASVGQDVYNKTCMVCHGTGVGGSPMLTDAAEWNARRAKGKDALYASAINGFIGTKGAMPARGANPNLSDAEVKAAVDYMLETAAK